MAQERQLTTWASALMWICFADVAALVFGSVPDALVL